MIKGLGIWFTGMAFSFLGLCALSLGMGADVLTGLQKVSLQILPSFLQSPLLGVLFLALGLLTFLGSLVYFGDNINILDEKIRSFEGQFSTAVENQTQTAVRKERMDAQRDLAEGVYSVLHSPLSSIRSDVTMFSVGLTQDQAAKKVDEINKQMDRIHKFLESLRRSGNPGQISQARCQPEKILRALLPEWSVRVKKYGATLIDKVNMVSEISLPERDIRTIFKGILEFSAERVSKNLYPKNVTISLETEKDGIHFSLIDNMNIKAENIEDLKNNMHLAIAIGTLERNYCNLHVEDVPGGGLHLSFDLVRTEDQTLESLTVISSKLDS